MHSISRPRFAPALAVALALAVESQAAPTLEWATYLAPTSFAGGDGLQNHGLAVTTDATGHVYVAGVTESASFPVTVGALDTSRNGLRDVYVAKLEPGGDALVWSTYLGGELLEIENNRALGIAVDADGAVYVAGSTKSLAFPTTPGAFQAMHAGNSDVFVAKLSGDGSELEYSTLVGGPGIEYAWDLAVDADGRAYVCGETNGDFPTTAGAFQTASESLSGFVFRLSADGTDLDWSTTIGVNTGKARAIAIDAAGNAFVTGLADAPHGLTAWPVTDGAFQVDGKGSFDAVVSKVSADGSELVFSSYLGGTKNEDGRGIAVDGSGNVYVAGDTNSKDFPADPGAFQSALQSTPFPEEDAFVVKIAASGSEILWGTYLGGEADEATEDLLLDGAGGVVVTGTTTSKGFPTTADAFQETFDYQSASFSAFVSRVGAGGTTLPWSTYLHPTTLTNPAFGYSIARDGEGAVTVVGSAGATFPTTAGAFQEVTFNPAFGGPYAAKFADVAATALCGDVTGDGKITAADALAMLKAVVASSACPPSVCDYTGDAKVTAADALATLRAAVGQSVVARCPAS